MSLYDQPYALSIFGSRLFVIKRPLENRLSIRTAGLPMGFRGLIADPLSDWLRNPACDLHAASFELYASGSDVRTLFDGATNQCGNSTFGVFVASSAVTDGRVERGEQQREGSGQSSFASSNDENRSAVAAAGLSSLVIGGDLALGIGCQYIHTQRLAAQRSGTE